MAINLTGITLASLLTPGTTGATDCVYLTADGAVWSIAKQQGATAAQPHTYVTYPLDSNPGTTNPYISQAQARAMRITQGGTTAGSYAIMQAAPDAFMESPTGKYDEVHASVPKSVGGGVVTLDAFPQMYVAMLRHHFEQQGIRFDTSMGAPPTMHDLQQQIQGHWSLWEDHAKDTWELTQRLPRVVSPVRCAQPGDIEAVFESEMTDALTRLIGALQARDSAGTTP